MSQTILKRAFSSTTTTSARGNLVDKFRLDLLLSNGGVSKASPFEVTSNRLMMTGSKPMHASHNTSGNAAKKAKPQRTKANHKKAEYSLGHLMGQKKTTRGLKANPFDVVSAKLL